MQVTLDCTHQIYSSGGISYISMDEPRYFNPDQKYDGISCQLCFTAFAPGDGITHYNKVDMRTPAYLCKNNMKGCEHLICHFCMQKNGLLAAKTVGGTRTLRSGHTKKV